MFWPLYRSIRFGQDYWPVGAVGLLIVDLIACRNVMNRQRAATRLGCIFIISEIDRNMPIYTITASHHLIQRKTAMITHVLSIIKPTKKTCRKRGTAQHGREKIAQLRHLEAGIVSLLRALARLVTSLTRFDLRNTRFILPCR
jgi:hypothetical protein